LGKAQSVLDQENGLKVPPFPGFLGGARLKLNMKRSGMFNLG